jgi:hypothetical protein
MASTENRVITVVGNKIRARWEAASAKSPAQAGSLATVPPALIREAFFSDFRAVVELKRRWGLVEDTFETWEHLWKRNPALAHIQSQPPIGWVLEAEGRIVGYLGNISLLCRYGEKTLTAAVGHGLAVDPPYRPLTLTLIAAFFRQRSADLYLSTTAKEAVGKMAHAFQSRTLPQAEYDTVLFWVLRPLAFAKSIAKMLSLNSFSASVGSVLASFAISTDTCLRRREPRTCSTGITVTEIAVNEIGSEFQKLWREKMNEPPRLFADRTLETIRWHFEIPGDRATTRVLCCSRNGELLGYAIIRDEAPEENSGLLKSVIADMVVKGDNPEAVEALLVSAYAHAKKAESHILELWGFPQSMRKVFAKSRPYARKYRACPYHYKAADPMLHEALSHGEAWYASPFDGDTTLTTRLPVTAGIQLDPGNEVATELEQGSPTMVL